MKKIKLANYDENGFLISIESYLKSQLSVNGGGIYLPANSTDILPPTDPPEGFQWQWNNEEWVKSEIPILDPEPDPEPEIIPDFDGFFEAIRKPVTHPLLNEIAVHSVSAKDDLRDAFKSLDFTKVITFWNEAVADYSANLIPILNEDIEGQTRKDFMNEAAQTYIIPLVLGDDYLLSVIGG